MSQHCEACERVEGVIIEPCDDAQNPYRLCEACHQRLHLRTLRPLEWYNLAKRHGWFQFLLHDDFYEEDGTATQPESDVEDLESFPAPTLSSVRQDPEKLLEYSFTRWHLRAEVIAAWQELDPLSVHATLTKCFDSDSVAGIKATTLSICAAAIPDLGADFVRRAWLEYPQTVVLASLAEASAACLPHAEGYDRVTSALARLKGRDKRDQMYCLSYFHSRNTLDWIERNIFEPITESWGYLAAASDMDWPRVEAWLDSGRPLSLVAIDALRAIAKPMTPLLRKDKPMLAAPPASASLQKVLLAYRERDPVPRVQHRIDSLLVNTGDLCLGQ